MMLLDGGVSQPLGPVCVVTIDHMPVDVCIPVLRSHREFLVPHLTSPSSLRVHTARTPGNRNILSPICLELVGCYAVHL